MSTGEPVEIDLADNAFTLTLHTTSGDIPSDGNSSWTTFVNLDTMTETTLSNPRLFLRDPSTGLQTEMPLADKIIVPAENYIRYVSMGFDYSQKTYVRQTNDTWKLDSELSSTSKIEYIRFNIYK